MDNAAVKDVLHRIPAENNLSLCAPLNQYDADNKEGDGSGEEIGSWYAVRHRLRLFWVTESGICACFDDGIGVVTIEQ